MKHTVELAITATGRRGDGIALWQGQTYFVPGAIAGDIVAVELPTAPPAQPTTVKLGTLVQPSPARTKPVCCHFGVCGGCTMQHLAMPAYETWKCDSVLSALHTHGIALPNDVQRHFSPAQSRRRATFAVQRHGKELLIGFNQANSHALIDLTACHVVCPAIMALLPGLRTGLRPYLGDAKGCDLRLTALDQGIDLVIVGGPPLGLRTREVLAALAHDLGLARISWRQWDRSTDELVVERQQLRVSFRHGAVVFPAGGFLQATREGESALIAAVTAGIGSAAPVADLFCGLGTFALSLAPRRLTAIDGDQAAITNLTTAFKSQSHVHVVRRDLIREPLRPQ